MGPTLPSAAPGSADARGAVGGSIGATRTGPAERSRVRLDGPYLDRHRGRLVRLHLDGLELQFLHDLPMARCDRPRGGAWPCFWTVGVRLCTTLAPSRVNQQAFGRIRRGRWARCGSAAAAVASPLVHPLRFTADATHPPRPTPPPPERPHRPLRP